MKVMMSPAELEGVRAQAADLEALVLGPVSTTVAQRWAFWQSLRTQAAALGASESRLAAYMPDVVAANRAADQSARKLAQVIAGLRTGAYELQPWATAQGDIQLGVIQRGGLGAFPLVTVLWSAATAVVAGGAWIVANLWATAKEMQAEAELTRAKTASKITDLVDTVGRDDPQLGAQLADALGRANDAANRASPGLLDSLIQSGRDLVQSVTGGGGWVWLGLLWLWSRSRSA